MLFAMTPVLFGMGMLAPKFFASKDRNARIQVITSPLWVSCQALCMWMMSIAVGALLADWTGAIVGAVAGAVIAAQGFASMGKVRQAVSGPPEARPALASAPTRRQITLLAVRVILFWAIVVGVTAGATYAVLGATAAVIVACVAIVVILLVHALMLQSLRRRQGSLR
jgi:hypothetical protein